MEFEAMVIAFSDEMCNMKSEKSWQTTWLGLRAFRGAEIPLSSSTCDMVEPITALSSRPRKRPSMICQDLLAW